LALEDLGYPTLHTQHLYEHEEIINMWNKEIFMPSIRSKEASMGKPNLQVIAKQFKATTDLPMALYFEQVLEEYPDCKFILTTRESSDVWFRSWSGMSTSISMPAYYTSPFFSSVRQLLHYIRWLFSIVNKDDSFLTQSFPFKDQNREASIASYEDHNRRVRAIIPPKQLLEYSVKEGWEPLCNFLEIDNTNCPLEMPFPKTNSMRSVKVQTMTAVIAPMMIVLFCLFYAFAKSFEKITGKTVAKWAQHKGRLMKVTARQILCGEKVCWTTSSSTPKKTKSN
jgi:hypothetical protein